MDTDDEPTVDFANTFAPLENFPDSLGGKLDHSSWLGHQLPQTKSADNLHALIDSLRQMKEFKRNLNTKLKSSNFFG